MATLATPGTAIKRGRTVQRTIVVISVCESVGEVMPIFISRLSDDSGASITGGCALAGNCAAIGAQPLLHVLPGVHAIGVGIENQDDRREAEHRLGSDRLDAGHAGERAFDRDADERFDFGCRQAGRLGLDLDHRRREFRKHIERNRRALSRARRCAPIAARANTTTAWRSEIETSQRIGYLPAPNSVPNSSAAPAVTTFFPASMPRAISVLAPTCDRISTRRRTKSCGPVAS